MWSHRCVVKEAFPFSYYGSVSPVIFSASVEQIASVGIYAANNAFWEKSAYPTPFCYLRPCVSFFGVHYLGDNKGHVCVILTALHLFALPLVILNKWANIHITSSGNLANRGMGVFAKLRKATISFVMSFCPSDDPSSRSFVCKEQFGSHWTDFHWIYISKIGPEN